MAADFSKKTIVDESLGDAWNMWYCELHNGAFGLNIQVNDVLHREESPYNKIHVLDLAHFGRSLVLYGSLMSTESDEHIYHELLAHIPMFVHPHPKRVLVLGGGEGASVREVVRHPEVEEVILCEIDERVVAVSREYFPKMASALDHPAVRIVYEDGFRFLSQVNGLFDVILVDGPDPVGPGKSLFQKSFHELAQSRLAPGGILCQQTESPSLHPHIVRPLYSNLARVFSNVHMYIGTIPFYPGGVWSFSFCSDAHHPIDDLKLDKKALLASMKLKYYNFDIHKGAFALPNFIYESCFAPEDCTQ